MPSEMAGGGGEVAGGGDSLQTRECQGGDLQAAVSSVTARVEGPQGPVSMSVCTNTQDTRTK